MTIPATLQKTIARTWKSAQLYIGFHKDQNGAQRREAKVWPPRNGNATIHADPNEQECFLVVKAADADRPRDVQVKLRPSEIVLRRDAGPDWQGVAISEHSVSVQVGGAWVHVNGDGSVTHELDGDTTYLESDGSVLKKTEFVEAMMSSDGVQLTRRTPNAIAAITAEGVVSKARKR